MSDLDEEYSELSKILCRVGMDAMIAKLDELNERNSEAPIELIIAGMYIMAKTCGAAYATAKNRDHIEVVMTTIKTALIQRIDQEIDKIKAVNSAEEFFNGKA